MPSERLHKTSKVHDSGQNLIAQVLGRPPKIGRLRARAADSARRFFLLAWQDHLPELTEDEIDQDIAATARAMRQLASLRRAGDV